MRLETEKREDISSQLRTQVISMDKLGKDNKQLKEEVEIAQREVASGHSVQGDLRILQAKIEYYQSEIESEKERLAELDKAVGEADARLKEQRKKVAGKTGDVTGPAAQGQKRTLENRLETALREYNSELTRNAAQRSTIDHLRTERAGFEGVAKKLGAEIAELKKATADLVEKSAQAHDGRDEALTKMAALRERSEKEEKQYHVDIKELTRVHEHDRKLKNFMAIKGQEKKDLQATQTLGKTKKTETREEDGSPEERLARLEALFEKIQAETKVASLDQAVDRFMQGEAGNFSAFNYVTELNSSIEQLQEKIAEQRGKAETASVEAAQAQRERERRFQGLKEEGKTQEARLAGLEAARDSARQQLEALTGPTQELFTQIGCERASLGDALGNETVNRSNVKLYLSVVEQRTNQLLQLRARLDARAKAKWEAQEAELRDASLGSGELFDPTATLGPKPQLPSLLGPGPKVQSPDAPIHAPSSDVLSDGEEMEDDQPFSLEQIKERLQRPQGEKEALSPTVIHPAAHKSMKKNASSVRVTKKR